jgi:signal transduction histidine kinase
MRRLLRRLRHPPTTVRWRLTLLYGGSFLICGAALLAVTYTLVAHASVAEGPAVFTRVPPGPGFQLKGPGNATVRPRVERIPQRVVAALRSQAGRAVVDFVGAKQRVSDLHQLEIESGIALAIMALISGLLGWIVAGRVLRPLRTITATTRQLSEANLHERLALAGPRDELRTLADTIDGLLERLERAFDAQRRFVANASHELRTPMTASRALLEMASTDPHATVQSLRAACLGALEEAEQQEQLVDALLALAQGERGLETRDNVDLAAVVREAAAVHAPEAATRGVALELETGSAWVAGDRRLLGRLVSNLLENAIHYNVPGGEVHLRVGVDRGVAALSVENTGPSVPAEEIQRLVQPFQRIARDRIGHGEGFGLGLSIVAAVASAHDAELEITPRTAGGLAVNLRFPPVSDVADHAHDHGPVGALSSVEDELQLGLG